MANVTYLIGAGASYHAVSTIQKMPGSLYEFRRMLHKDDKCQDPIKKKIIDCVDDVLAQIIDVDHYAKEQKVKLRQASVDTYAKKLYIRMSNGDPNAETKFNDLKLMLTVFIAYEQVLNKPDYRYDSFFSSIISEDTLRPADKVQIISWNYDSQLEFSLMEFLGVRDPSEVRSFIKIFNKSAGRFLTPSNIKAFKIFKINGTASFFYGGKEIIPRKMGDESLSDFACNWYRQRDQYSPGISYAWEVGNNIENEAAQSINDTDVLVIIGYSFPFFNRKIDSILLKDMGLLKKVYIQDPDASAVRDRFLALRPDFLEAGKQIVTMTKVELFHMPDEMSL